MKIIKLKIGKFISGFTLLETLIYVALIMFVITAGVMSAFYLIDSSDKDNSEINALVEAEFLLRKIDWVLTGIETIYFPLIVTPGDTLRLDKSSGPPTIEISLDTTTSRARLQRDTNPYIYLTGDRVKMTNMKFTYINNIAPKPDAVKAEFYADGKYFELYKYLRK